MLLFKKFCKECCMLLFKKFCFIFRFFAGCYRCIRSGLELTNGILNTRLVDKGLYSHPEIEPNPSLHAYIFFNISLYNNESKALFLKLLIPPATHVTSYPVL